MIFCPKGHEMEKKGYIDEAGKRIIVKKCREVCAEYRNCRFNHDVSACFWCNQCKKHYHIWIDRKDMIWSVS